MGRLRWGKADQRRIDPFLQARTPAPTRRIRYNVDPTPDEFDATGYPKVAYANNAIQTSKYTPLTFLPRNLAEQFRKVANLFFLLLDVLQFLAVFNVANPFLSAVPLIIITALTAVKDGFEDWSRHKSDTFTNGQEAKRLQGDRFDNSNGRHLRPQQTEFIPQKSGLTGLHQRLSRRFHTRKQGHHGPKSHSGTGPMHWETCCWQDVHVGDVLLLTQDDPIPADLVVFATSNSESICYVETKNLDGETNLKIRHSLAETQELGDDPEKLVGFNAVIEVELPSPNLQTINGKISFNLPASTHDGAALASPAREVAMASEAWEHKSPITINNILLRGCNLRNTDWVVGLVIYTGEESRLRLNAGKTPSKRSVIDKHMNKEVILNMGFLVAMCIVVAVMGDYYTQKHLQNLAPFIPATFAAEEYNRALQGVITFWSALITFQNLIPISLYLTVEIVKTLQSYFLYADEQMYYAMIDQPCKPRSWNLADDLGQIEYILSDKTGTLTRNQMELKQISCGGIIYEQEEPGVNDIDADKRSATTVNGQQHIRNPFTNVQLAHDLRHGPDVLQEQLHMFWLCLAICHTVLVSTKGATLNYQAQSPDEGALVQAAAEAGFALQSSAAGVCTIQVLGALQTWEILNVVEFNSDRKRMSVFVRRVDEPDTILLFCKGADSVIYDRLGGGQNASRQDLLIHLDNFAAQGLRTLCLSYKILTKEAYMTFAHAYNEASTSLGMRDQEMELVASAMERELQLLGATAIEDKLQEGVPNAVFKLRQSGLKIWVLTGDKVETAINIGFSSNLIDTEMEIILIRGNNGEKTHEEEQMSVWRQIHDAIMKFFPEQVGGVLNPPKETSHRERLKRSKHDASRINHNNCALVVDDLALHYALHPKASALFMSLATQCRTVFCCRVSPLQKAKVVELVKDYSGAMCLAIGDGANDVSMIQAAQVGVGISGGEEGQQAVMAADYSIAQFRFLERLLLVHGRWSYVRVSKLIFTFFFKNVIWIFPMFVFQFYSLSSSQLLYLYPYLLLYNLLLSSLPVIVLGVFEQDLWQEYIPYFPLTYAQGLEQKLVTFKEFLLVTFEAIYQSIVCFFIPMYALGEHATHRHDTLAGSLTRLSMVVCICSCLNANLYIAVRSNNWSWILVGIQLFGFFCLVVFTLIYSSLDWKATGGEPITGIAEDMFRLPHFWFSLVMTVFLSHLPRTLFAFIHSQIAPSDMDLAREIQKYGMFDGVDLSYVGGDCFPEEPPTSGDAVKATATMAGSTKTKTSKIGPDDESSLRTAVAPELRAPAAMSNAMGSREHGLASAAGPGLVGRTTTSDTHRRPSRTMFTRHSSSAQGMLSSYPPINEPTQSGPTADLPAYPPVPGDRAFSPPASPLTRIPDPAAAAAAAADLAMLAYDPADPASPASDPHPSHEFLRSRGQNRSESHGPPSRLMSPFAHGHGHGHGHGHSASEHHPVAQMRRLLAAYDIATLSGGMAVPYDPDSAAVPAMTPPSAISGAISPTADAPASSVGTPTPPTATSPLPSPGFGGAPRNRRALSAIGDRPHRLAISTAAGPSRAGAGHGPPSAALRGLVSPLGGRLGHGGSEDALGSRSRAVIHGHGHGASGHSPMSAEPPGPLGATAAFHGPLTGVPHAPGTRRGMTVMATGELLAPRGFSFAFSPGASMAILPRGLPASLFAEFETTASVPGRATAGATPTAGLAATPLFPAIPLAVVETPSAATATATAAASPSLTVPIAASGPDGPRPPPLPPASD